MLLHQVTSFAYRGCATDLLQAFPAFRRPSLRGEHPAVLALLAGNIERAAEILRDLLRIELEDPSTVGQRAPHAVVVDDGIETKPLPDVTLRITPIPDCHDGTFEIRVDIALGVMELDFIRRLLDRGIPNATVLAYRDLYGEEGTTTLYDMLKYSGE